MTLIPTPNDPRQIHPNLEADACARKEIEWHYPDGGGRPLSDKLYVARLSYIIRVFDSSGKTIEGFKLGYRLGRIPVARLTHHRVFDLSGDGIFLAVYFYEEFDPRACYRLEYFDDVYFLFKWDSAIEDPALSRFLR